jgi:uncharacterized membrane protein YjfL (UPF0719 family)
VVWLATAPPLAVFILYRVLRWGASYDVRESGEYLFFYLVLGSAWLALGMQGLAYAGISARDDVLEGGNHSAAYAVTGALLGIMLSFAGGNVGDGPGWWVVVFCAALATGTLFAAWFVLDRLTGIVDVITVDRDIATGIRAGGFLVACGLVLGRSVAGDWSSASTAIGDFARLAWPLLLLLTSVIWLERLAHPTHDRPTPSALVYGVLPGVLYVAVAVHYVLRLGYPV